MPSESKPAVDQAPYQWTHDGEVLDLFAASQEPYEYAPYSAGSRQDHAFWQIGRCLPMLLPWSPNFPSQVM